MKYLVGTRSNEHEVEADRTCISDAGLEFHNDKYTRVALFREYTFYIQLPEPPASPGGDRVFTASPAVEIPF